MVVGGCAKRIAHRIALAAAMELHEERLATAKSGADNANDRGDNGLRIEAAEALSLRTNRLTMSTLLEDCAFASVQRTVEEIMHDASTMLSMMPEHLAKYDFELGQPNTEVSRRRGDKPSLLQKVAAIAEAHFTSISLARQIIRSLPQPPPPTKEGEGSAESHLNAFVVMPMTSVRQLCSAVQTMALEGIEVNDERSGGNEPSVQLAGALAGNIDLVNALNELELLGALKWDALSASELDLSSLRPLVWKLGTSEASVEGDRLL